MLLQASNPDPELYQVRLANTPCSLSSSISSSCLVHLCIVISASWVCLRVQGERRAQPNPNVRDREGLTPLHVALLNGNVFPLSCILHTVEWLRRLYHTHVENILQNNLAPMHKSITHVMRCHFQHFAFITQEQGLSVDHTPVLLHYVTAVIAAANLEVVVHSILSSWPALVAGHLECVQTLLEAGTDVAKQCEGSPPLHIAVCVGALPQKENFAEAAVRKLLTHGAMPYER